jgi:hypothetical protein
MRGKSFGGRVRDSAPYAALRSAVSITTAAFHFFNKSDRGIWREAGAETWVIAVFSNSTGTFNLSSFGRERDRQRTEGQNAVLGGAPCNRNLRRQ